MGCCCLAAFALLEGDLGPFRWTALADGDNCLVFVERRVASLVHQRFGDAVALVSAQELAVEKPVAVLEEITFGQSRPCYNGVEYTMVRPPFKVLSQAFSGYRHYNHYKFGLRLAASVARAELHLARGVPVLEAYFAAALERLGGVRPLPNPEDYLEGHLLDALRAGALEFDSTPRGVSEEARRSFALAWGLGVEEQLSLERQVVDSLEGFPNPGYLDVIVEMADRAGPEIDHVAQRVDLGLSRSV
jgi:hypothetical protein